MATLVGMNVHFKFGPVDLDTDIAKRMRVYKYLAFGFELAQMIFTLRWKKNSNQFCGVIRSKITRSHVTNSRSHTKEQPYC